MKKLNTSEFQERLNQIYGENYYIVQSEYINNCTKIDILCSKCGEIFQKAPVKMTGKEREGCYICSGKNRYKTKEYLQNQVNRLYPNKFEIIDDYINSRTKINILNKKCGHIYEITPDNLLRGKNCPKCSIRQSHYMDIVENYLDSNNISYIKEKTFDDCRNIRKLPFDYYIESLNTCIEVDGEFHYDINNRFKDWKSSYEQVKFRDQLKTDYCKNNDIKLIRLPYYEEYNFSNILDKELKANTEVTN